MAAIEDSKKPKVREKCVLVCGAKRFVVNKSVLRSRCFYFRLMFECEMKESLSNLVTFDVIGATAMETMLHYIDSKTFPSQLSEDLLVEIISTSHMLMMDDLYEECCRRLQLTPSNYPFFRQISALLKSGILTEVVIRFQAKHFAATKAELYQLPVEDLEYMLTKTEIRATNAEIVEFFFTWCQLPGNYEYFNRVLPFIDMSSIPDKILGQLLNHEVLSINSGEMLEICKEKAYMDQINFISLHNKGFRVYTLRNNKWSVYRKFSQFIKKKKEVHKMFYIDQYFYVIHNVRPSSVVVTRLDFTEGHMVDQNYIDVVGFFTAFVSDDRLYFMSSEKDDSFGYVNKTLGFHLYDYTTNTLQNVTSICLRKPDELDLGAFIPCGRYVYLYVLDLVLYEYAAVYEIDLTNGEWMKVDILNDITESRYILVSYQNCLCALTFERPELDILERRVHFYRFLSDQRIWEKNELPGTCQHNFCQWVYLPPSRFKAMPYLYFLTEHKTLVEFDLHNNTCKDLAPFSTRRFCFGFLLT